MEDENIYFIPEQAMRGGINAGKRRKTMKVKGVVKVSWKKSLKALNVEDAHSHDESEGEKNNENENEVPIKPCKKSKKHGHGLF